MYINRFYFIKYLVDISFLIFRGERKSTLIVPILLNISLIFR